MFFIFSIISFKNLQSRGIVRAGILYPIKLKNRWMQVLAKKMKKSTLLIIMFSLSMLASCTGSTSRNSPTAIETKVKATAAKTNAGQPTGPIFLNHRKLGLKEISKHLDMDEETTELHLKSTNIHGYFSLIANNYPPNTHFTLYRIELSGRVIPSKTFFVNNYGEIFATMDDAYIALSNNFLFFSNYLPGEPVDFILASKDDKYFAATRIIPNPIEVVDGKGRKISVEIASPNKRKYRIYCSGFNPFESYMLIAQFENEKFVHALKANENGEMFQITGSTIPWITSGNGSVELRGDAIHRPIHLNFQWGA